MTNTDEGSKMIEVKKSYGIITFYTYNISILKIHHGINESENFCRLNFFLI